MLSKIKRRLEQVETKAEARGPERPVIEVDFVSPVSMRVVSTLVFHPDRPGQPERKEPGRA